MALGSNLGDRRGHIQWAADRLTALLHDVRLSTITESQPFEVPDLQPPYLNALAAGHTDHPPDVILAQLLALERDRGRDRRSYRAARTLDLDLILYGDVVLDTPELTLPHARFRSRLFVLEPLVELAPEFIDPVTGKTMAELFAALRAGETDAV
ncbi:MAG: 2-amino-4-hydroxy-6-hydroxymethyldihydropteridine diphosphokinase [Vicinamibacterales bacterium]